MDDESPRRRWSPRAWWLTITGTATVLAIGATAWLLSRTQEPEPPPNGEIEPPPKFPDGTEPTGGETPATGADGAQHGSDTATGGDDVDSCDVDLSDHCGNVTCDDAACDSSVPSCDASVPSCDTSTTGCQGAGSMHLIGAAVSAASVLPLVTVDKLAPRRIGSRSRVTVPARCAGAAITGYRRWVSPHTRTRCRYRPRCSSYGRTVIRRHGLAAGSGIALRRIRRCRPDVPIGTPDPPP